MLIMQVFLKDKKYPNLTQQEIELLKKFPTGFSDESD